MANVTIRNKKTGETKQVPIEEVSRYIGGTSIGQPAGDNQKAVQLIQQRLQELQQPQQSQQQGGMMQGIAQKLPMAGNIAGSILGNVGGPLGRMAAGAAGAGVGEQVSQMAQGKSGDPMAALSAVNPLFAMLNAAPHAMSQLKGEEPKLSSVEKAQQTGAKVGLTGEALAGLAKFILTPGTKTKAFSNITDFLSKRASGLPSKKFGIDVSTGTRGIIKPEVLENRFIEETVPKALKSSGELVEETIKEKGKDLLSKVGGNLGMKEADAELLNFIRSQLNAVGKGNMKSDLTKFLANDLARIIKEEQLKLVPEAGASILGGRLSYQIPQMLRQLPFGRALLGTGAGGNQGLLGLLGGGVAKAGGAVSKFLLPGMMQGQGEEQ